MNESAPVHGALCGNEVGDGNRSVNSPGVEPTEHDTIKGLYMWQADPVSLARLRESVKKLFEEYTPTNNKHGRRRMSDMIELGSMFSVTEKTGSYAFEPKTEAPEYAEVLGFIAAQLAGYRATVRRLSGLSGSSSDAPAAAHTHGGGDGGGADACGNDGGGNDANLNVVLRRYTRGQSIGFHTDRVDKLDDMVWSCILEAGGPRDGVAFQFPPDERAAAGGGGGGRGGVGDTELPPGGHATAAAGAGGGGGNKRARAVLVPERPGLVMVQTGPARSVYKHGVRSVEGQERVSLTWRFFKPAYLATLDGYAPDPRRLAPFKAQVAALSALSGGGGARGGGGVPPPLPPPVACLGLPPPPPPHRALAAAGSRGVFSPGGGPPGGGGLALVDSEAATEFSSAALVAAAGPVALQAVLSALGPRCLKVGVICTGLGGFGLAPTCAPLAAPSVGGPPPPPQSPQRGAGGGVDDWTGRLCDALGSALARRFGSEVPAASAAAGGGVGPGSCAVLVCSDMAGEANIGRLRAALGRVGGATPPPLPSSFSSSSPPPQPPSSVFAAAPAGNPPVPFFALPEGPGGGLGGGLGGGPLDGGRFGRGPGPLRALVCDAQRPAHATYSRAEGAKLLGELRAHRTGGGGGRPPQPPPPPPPLLSEEEAWAEAAAAVQFSGAADVYVLLEGGFRAAAVALEVRRKGKPLVQVPCTGGAAAGWVGNLGLGPYGGSAFRANGGGGGGFDGQWPVSRDEIRDLALLNGSLVPSAAAAASSSSPFAGAAAAAAGGAGSASSSPCDAAHAAQVATAIVNRILAAAQQAQQAEQQAQAAPVQIRAAAATRPGVVGPPAARSGAGAVGSSAPQPSGLPPSGSVGAGRRGASVPASWLAAGLWQADGGGDAWAMGGSGSGRSSGSGSSQPDSIDGVEEFEQQHVGAVAGVLPSGSSSSRSSSRSSSSSGRGSTLTLGGRAVGWEQRAVAQPAPLAAAAAASSHEPLVNWSGLSLDSRAARESNHNSVRDLFWGSGGSQAGDRGTGGGPTW